MCQTDRPDDEPLAAPVDPTAEETGLWPLPHLLLDAAAAGSVNPEPELARAETDQAEVTDIPPQDRRETETARPPESAADSTPRIIAAISQLGTLVEHRLTGLQTLFDREIRAEATRERIVDRLHAELQEYKQDLLLKSAAADLHRPDSAPRRHRQDDRGPAGRRTRPSGRAARHPGIDSHRNRGYSLSPGSRTVPARGRRLRPPPPALGVDRPHRRPRAQQDHRRPAAPGFQAGEKLIRPEIVSVHILKK